MKTSFRILAVAVFLLGPVYGARADSYDGPGFSGTAWYGESGCKSQKAGSVHVDVAGFLMNVESQGMKVSSLIKWDSDIVWSIMHDQKIYMEMSPDQSGWESYEARPCMGYKGGKKQGSETLNGRATEKWHCTGQTMLPQGEQAYDATVWYDPELQFSLKTASENGDIFEIRDIKVGAQDASMFKIPSSYQKLDMNKMMQQGQQ